MALHIACERAPGFPLLWCTLKVSAVVLLTRLRVGLEEVLRRRLFRGIDMANIDAAHSI